MKTMTTIPNLEAAGDAFTLLGILIAGAAILMGTVALVIIFTYNYFAIKERQSLTPEQETDYYLREAWKQRVLNGVTTEKVARGIYEKNRKTDLEWTGGQPTFRRQKSFE